MYRNTKGWTSRQEIIRKLEDRARDCRSPTGIPKDKRETNGGRKFHLFEKVLEI